MTLLLVWIIGFVIVFMAWPYFMGKAYESIGTAIDNDDLETAANQLKWAVPLSFESGGMLYLRAHLHLKRGDPSAALRDLNLTIKRNHRSADYRNFRASLLEQQYDFAGSLHDYEEAKFYMPGNVEATVGSIRLRLRMGLMQEALRDAEAYVEDQPESAPAFYARGYAYVLFDRTDEACKDFQQASVLHTTYVDPLIALSVLHIMMDAYDEARMEIDRVLALDADNLSALHNQIVIDIYTGHLEDAVRTADALVARLPDETQPLLARALTHIHRGQYEDARNDLNAARALDPKRLEIDLWLGDLALLQKDYDTAEAHYRAVLAVNPHEPEALANRALITYQRGDKGEALRSWKLVLTYDRRYANLDWLHSHHRSLPAVAEIAVAVASLYLDSK